MSGVAPTHSDDSAQLWKPGAAIESFILMLMAHDAVVDIDVVSDEDTVAHEPHEAVRDLGENRRTADHLVRDAGDLPNLGRDGSLRIYEGMPLVDDLVVADLDRGDFGYPIDGRPAASRLDVDHEVVLLGIRVYSSPSTRLAHFLRDLRFLPSRLAFALTVRSAGFNAAATTAVAACRVFFPTMALDAIRIVSVCAAAVPDVTAATFSDTIRFSSALFLGAIPAAKKIGHRHHSVMLVSITAAPRSTANWNGVCRCAIWVKLHVTRLFRTAAMPELYIAPFYMLFMAALGIVLGLSTGRASEQ